MKEISRKDLTRKEEEVMNLFWEHGPLFVREMLMHYEEPKPHFNTLSTVVRGLEEKGFVAHKTYGPTYQYYATLSREEMGGRSLKSIASRFFNNSYQGIVSALVTDEDMSVSEIRELLDEIEKASSDQK